MSDTRWCWHRDAIAELRELRARLVVVERATDTSWATVEQGRRDLRNAERQVRR